MTFPAEAMILSVVAVVALAALTLVLRGHGNDSASAERWSAARGLHLTDDNAPMVRHYLRTARFLRRAGAVTGLALSLLLTVARGDRVPGMPGSWIWMILGYLFGALGAEIALGRPLSGTAPRASLVRRDLVDYLPGFLRWTDRGIAGLTVVLGMTVALVGFERAESTGMGHLSDLAALAVAALAVAVTVVLEGVQRWIVARPQPFVATDILEADDAIRSQSVTSIAGAGIAILLLLVATLWWQLASSDVQVLRWTAWVPAIACSGAALASWLRFGHFPSQVARGAAVPSSRPT